ncbi:MAG: M28 family peptidase [Anaerolineae bacterium]
MELTRQAAANFHQRLAILFLFLLLAACAALPDDAPMTAEAAIPPPATPVPAAPSPTVALPPTAVPQLTFDGEHAFAYLEAQMALGPRWPGSPGHTAVRDYIISQLSGLGWEVEEQPFDYQGFPASNIIARANQGQGDVIILGAHYDTRRIADQTPGAVEAELPVPGAVDGASGVAVLLELARTLDLDAIPREVWLAFFDVEDNGRGGIPGWDYIAGSAYMAANLAATPEAVVVVDMIGDADQQLFHEGNSDPALRQLLWNTAAELGYGDVFVPSIRYTMIDDHLPFARRGIPAVDIIDFDYPYWHTVEDTADKASAASLMRVGHTLEVWLESKVGR